MKDEIFDTRTYHEEVNRDIATMEVVIDSFVGSVDKVDQVTDVEKLEEDINYVVSKSTRVIGYVSVFKMDYGIKIGFSLMPAQYTLAALGTEKMDDCAY